MDNREFPLIDHLQELRKRLVFSATIFLFLFTIFYYFSQDLFNFLLKPLTKLLEELPGERKLIYTGVAEAFVTYIKISAFFALLFSLPVFLTQLWFFIAPGLYKKEKKIFRFFLFSTPLLFILGSVFAYYVIFPTAYKFFLSFETADQVIPIQLEARISEYLSFAMRLVLVFGVCFELPIALCLLAWTQTTTYKTLSKHWRIAVVSIFTASAILTPPDIISMIGLAIPLVILYMASLKMVKFIERYKYNQNA